MHMEGVAGKKEGVSLRRHRGRDHGNSSSAVSRSQSPYGDTKRKGDVSNQKRLTLGVIILLFLGFSSLMRRSRKSSTNGIDIQSMLLGVSRMETFTKRHGKLKLWTEPPLTNFSLQELKDHPTLAPAKQLKVNYPIFVASFSKSGTTSTYYAFACYLGYDYVAHRWTTDVNKNGMPELIGRCMEQNVIRNKPPFQGCGKNYFNRTQTVVWTDTAYIGGENGCYNPNLQALDAIWEAHPTATLLLVRRNASAWYRSANSQRAGFIRKWKAKCRDMPNNRSEAVWVEFYNNYTQRVRQFAEERKGQMTYVEIELEDPNSGKILEQKMGLPASCWKNCPSSFTTAQCQELGKENKNNTHKNEKG